MEPHAYWAVWCKSKWCRTPIFLKDLGIYDSNQEPQPLDCSDNFPTHCGLCNQTNTYSREDVVVIQLRSAA